MGGLWRDLSLVVGLAGVPALASVPWLLHLYTLRPLRVLALVAMRLVPWSSTVQLVGCASIWSFAWNDSDGKHILYAVAGIQPIIQALQRFPDDKNVQLSCLQAAGAMSLYSYFISTDMGEAGAVELNLNAMQRWPDDPNYQLGNIAGCFMDFSFRNRARWSTRRGMEMTFDSIKNHYWNPTVQFNSWCAFSCGTQDPNQRKFVELGGIETAAKVLRDHPRSYRVREEVLQSTRAVAMFSAEFRDRMVAAGFLELAVLSMREAPLDFHVQSPACANLALLSSSATHRARAVEAGAVDAAVEAVRRFPEMVPPLQWAHDDQYKVYADCMEALVAVANLTAARDAMRAGRLRDVLGPVLQGRADDARVQGLGRQLLGAL